MTRLLIILLSALVLCASVFAGQAPVIRGGSEQDFRPYAYTDENGRPTGFGPDLLRAVADKMGMPLQITPASWDQGWNDLVAGRIEVLPIVARTPGREAQVDFSLPHTETFDAFFVREGSPYIPDLAAARGKEIVVLRSDAAHHQLVERKFAGTIIPVDSIADGLRLIAAGRHDAFLCSKVIGVLEREQAGIKGIADGPLIPDYKRTFSFAVPKGNAELLEKLNQGLRITKADGTYDRLYDKWLGINEPPSARWQTSFWQAIGMLGVVMLLAATWLVTRKALALDYRQSQALAVPADEPGALFWRYALAVIAVAASLAVRTGLEAWTGPGMSTFMVFYPAITLAALLGGIGPGVLATALAALAATIWIIPPIGELRIASSVDQLGLVLFCGMGMFMVAVAELSRRNRAKAAAFDREAATRDSEERYRHLVEQAVDGIFLADAQGRYLDANAAGTAMLGYTLEEMRGLTLVDLLAPEEVARLPEQLSKLATGSVLRNEWRFRRKDGSTFIGELVGRQLPDGRLLGTVRDVSERRALEDALIEAKKTADQANRAKSFFLANMSHEMRTPLNAIVGLCHLLRRDLAERPVRTRLDQMIAASDHLAGLISDVLEMSRIEAGQLTLEIGDFCLGNVVNRVHEVLAWPARAKGLTLNSEVRPELLTATFRGDALRLTQILINLGGNAVKFTERGSVCLRIEAASEMPQGRRLRFAVIDTGVGIAAEDQAQLFAPFTQVGDEPISENQGSGLGLLISQQLVNAMGGRIDVASTPGAGSTFSFEIELPHANAAIAVAPTAAQDFTGRRVLVAEDDLLSQEITFEMLENLGCEVEVASDGAEAVEAARSADYDLILMDIRLPKMDGLAAARAIRALPRHRRTPIIALSANAFGEDRERCLAAGMDAHLAKPMTPARLAAALAQWLPGVASPAGSVDCDDARIGALRGLACLDTHARCWPTPRDVTAYVDLLQRFVAQGQDETERLRTHIAAGDSAKAQDIAHKLTGIAGLVGAQPIAALTEHIVTALRRGVVPAAVAGDAAACAAALRELATALDTLPVASTEPAACDAGTDQEAATFSP